MGLRSPVSSVLLLFIFLFLTYTIDAELDKVICAGKPCTINGSPGSAAYLRNCKSVLDAFRNGIPLSVVGYYFFEPIVCCPLNESISTSPTTTIETTPQPSSAVTTTETTLPPSSTTTTTPIKSPEAIVEQQCKIYKDLPRATVWPYAGGHDVFLSEYNVAIYVGNSTAFENFRCGGTLISERYVVTAGHCTYSINGGIATWIQVDVININEIGGQSIKIIDRKKHPCYKIEGRFTHHDIALLELERNVTFDGHVQLACLPFTSLNFTEVKGSGWGINETYGDIMHLLQKAYIRIEECDSKAEWKLCSNDTGKGACQGDSGGPLTIFNEEYRMNILVGVVSQGPDCGNGTGIYANVSYYIPWIQSIVWPTEDYNEVEVLKNLKCSYS